MTPPRAQAEAEQLTVEWGRKFHVALSVGEWAALEQAIAAALAATEARYREALEQAIAALKGCDGLIGDAQIMLAQHLPPDGPSENTTINNLLGLLDGSHQRKVADDTNTALHSAAAILARSDAGQREEV